MVQKNLLKLANVFANPAYEEVLSELTDVKYNQEGQPIVPLEKLWQKEEQQLPKED